MTYPAVPRSEGSAVAGGEDSRAMRRAVLLLVALALLPAGRAGADACTPPERVRLCADGAGGPSGGWVEVDGTVGAFAFRNRVDAGPSGVRVSDPPAMRSFELSQGQQGPSYLEPYGPYVARATIGTGGITAGVDAAGRLSNLSWPGPGMYEHLNYATLSRGQPNQAAPANAGSFGGLVLCPEICIPEAQHATWLHPGHDWETVSQSYASDRSQTLVTVLRNDALGITATVTDVVDPVDDLLARNVRIECNACAPGFAYYTNANPTTARVPRVPSVTDAAADNVADFGTVYDATASAMLHFRPYKADPTSLTRLATGQPGAGAAAEAVSGAFGPGVYVAVAGQGRAAQHQAGADSFGLVREEAEGTPALDPYDDLLPDGRLSGSPAAFGKTAGALGGLPADADGSYTVYLAAAADAQTALGAIERARARGFAAIRAASEAWWGEWTARARLPAADDRVRTVGLRALMLTRTAMDRTTGAIVAKATTQWPYRQDWVRDGAFFNYALLLAGYPELAIRHADFYRRVYRTGGTWDSFYYPDGAEAGAAWPYEVDSQGFALWALWLPYAMGGAGTDYLERAYPAIADTAGALALCRDPRTGLMCPGPEDDAVFPYATQGTQGASIAYLALRSAADAADALARDADRAAGWRARADEIRSAVTARLCTPAGCGTSRGGIYAAWPSRLLDGAPMEDAHLDALAAMMDARAAHETPGVGGSFGYPMEPLIALAPRWSSADRDARLAAWVGWLTGEVVDDPLDHFGESIFRCDGEPPCAPGERYLHTVFPHVWSGIEMYIGAALAAGVEGCPPGVATIDDVRCA